MNTTRTNPAAKAAAWLLLAVFALCAGFFGSLAVFSLDWQSLDYWQDSSAFQQLCQLWSDRVATNVTDSIAADSSSISYVERQQLNAAIAEFQTASSADATSYRYRLLNRSGQVLESNLPKGETLLTQTAQVHYASVTPGEYAADPLDSYGYYAQYYGWSKNALDSTDDEQYILEYGVAEDPPVSDSFAQLKQEISLAQVRFFPRIGAALGLLFGALVCLGYILWSAGWRTGAAKATASRQDRIYLEVYIVLWAFGTALALCPIFVSGSMAGVLNATRLSIWENRLLIGSGAVCCTVVALAGALLLRTLVVRVRTGTLGHSILVCRLWRGLCRRGGQAVRVLPFTWRTILAFLCYFFLNLLLFLLTDQQGGVFAALAWLALNIAVLVFLCRWAISFRQLCQGAEAIAQGDLDYQIDVQRMPGDLRTHAQALNNIAAGLSGALEEKMKSERFKAELITNVSHDLKTPLTSIINYVDLLKTTQQTDPNAQAYIEVLDRKSQRLKKLTEDLVEASKASTGVLRVEREKIGLAQLLDQALGEWTEKLESRRLTVVPSVPDGETWVYADGRHLWRVIDNLLSNCAKYAMEGTRVYLDLTRGKGQVSLSVKNISREPLNIPPERLMERFVRGEESRSTEGSGLGLSIARSLTELQGGTFALSVDGDLFKATVTLPQG